MEKISITANPNFIQWFGNSKVVDKTGRPLVVYHGTKFAFTSFNPDTPGNNDNGLSYEPVNRSAFFFTTDPNEAEYYAQDYTNPHAASNIMPVYLSIQRPKDLRHGLLSFSAKEFNNLVKYGANEKQLRHVNENDMWELFDGENGHKFVSALKLCGYDGAIVPETGGGFSWAAFSPNQIKSAIGNKGTYSLSSNKMNERHIKENPDSVKIGNAYLQYDDNDAIAFGFDLINKKSIFRAGFEDTHPDILKTWRIYGRESTPAAGRLWINAKIVSFWQVPTHETFELWLSKIHKWISSVWSDPVDVTTFRYNWWFDGNNDELVSYSEFCKKIKDYEPIGNFANGRLAQIDKKLSSNDYRKIYTRVISYLLTDGLGIFLYDIVYNAEKVLRKVNHMLNFWAGEIGMSDEEAKKYLIAPALPPSLKNFNAVIATIKHHLEQYDYFKRNDILQQNWEIEHVKSPLLKQKQINTGFGSNLQYQRAKDAGYDNVAKWNAERRPNYERKLRETPDQVRLPSDWLDWRENGAIAFGYQDVDGNLEFQAAADMKHYKIFKTDRENLSLAGRLWSAQGVISFWSIPTLSELEKFIVDMSKWLSDNKLLVNDLKDFGYDWWYDAEDKLQSRVIGYYQFLEKIKGVDVMNQISGEGILVDKDDTPYRKGYAEIVKKLLKDKKIELSDFIDNIPKVVDSINQSLPPDSLLLLNKQNENTFVWREFKMFVKIIAKYAAQQQYIAQQLSQQHTVSPLFKQKTANTGFGSDLQYQQAKQSGYDNVAKWNAERRPNYERKLKEGPDNVVLARGKELYCTDKDAIAFIKLNNVIYHMSGGRSHLNLLQKLENKKLFDWERDAGNWRFRGRVWIKSKVISFWDYPKNKNEIVELFNYLKRRGIDMGHMSEWTFDDWQNHRMFSLNKYDALLHESKINYGEKYKKYKSAISEKYNFDIDNFKRVFSGGKSEKEKKIVTDFRLDQILKGIDVEFEHTKSPNIALEITMDHLTEFGNYYSALEKTEQWLSRHAVKRNPKSDNKFEEYRDGILKEYDFDINDFDAKLKDGRYEKNKRNITDFDLEQIFKGIDVELEHSKEINDALDITLDHLDKFFNYYDGLKKMEERLKIQKKSKNTITENPDTVYVRPGQTLHVSDNEAFAFAQYKGIWLAHHGYHFGLAKKIAGEDPNKISIAYGDFKYRGRVWCKHKIISFYEVPESQQIILNVLTNLQNNDEIRGLGYEIGDIKDWLFDNHYKLRYGDESTWGSQLVPVTSLGELYPQSNNVSDSSISSPPMPLNKVQRKASAMGYDNVAQWRANTTQYQYTEQSLKENPDRGVDSEGNYHNWMYGYMFGYNDDDELIIDSGMTHVDSDIDRQRNLCGRFWELDEGRILISFWNDVPQSLMISTIQDIISKLNNTGMLSGPSYKNINNWEIDLWRIKKTVAIKDLPTQKNINTVTELLKFDVPFIVREIGPFGYYSLRDEYIYVLKHIMKKYNIGISVDALRNNNIVKLINAEVGQWFGKAYIISAENPESVDNWNNTASSLIAWQNNILQQNQQNNQVMNQQHVLSPIFRQNKSNTGFGSNLQYQQAKQSGYNNVAKWNAERRPNYERKLKENPDSVRAQDELHYDLSWRDYKQEPVFVFGWKKGSNELLLVRSTDEYNETHYDAFHIRRKDFSLCGRAWFNEKIISFWQKPSKPRITKVLLSILDYMGASREDIHQWRIDWWWTDQLMGYDELSSDSEMLSKITTLFDKEFNDFCELTGEYAGNYAAKVYFMAIRKWLKSKPAIMPSTLTNIAKDYRTIDEINVILYRMGFSEYQLVHNPLPYEKWLFDKEIKNVKNWKQFIKTVRNFIRLSDKKNKEAFNIDHVLPPMFKQNKVSPNFGSRWQQQMAKAMGYDTVAQWKNDTTKYQYTEKKSNLTDNPAFKAWFKNSQVVDRRGNPLMVFHGTDQDFNEFKINSGDLNAGNSPGGIFFTNNAFEAGNYAVSQYMTQYFEQEPGPNLKPVYLSVQNPLKIKAFGRGGNGGLIEKAMEKAYANGNDGIIIYGIKDAPEYFFNSYHDPKNEPDDWQSRIQHWPYAENQNLYIVFSPNQVKSVYNPGTYSTESNAINEQISSNDDNNVTYMGFEFFAFQMFSAIINQMQIKYPNQTDFFYNAWQNIKTGSLTINFNNTANMGLLIKDVGSAILKVLRRMKVQINNKEIKPTGERYIYIEHNKMKIKLVISKATAQHGITVKATY